MSRTARTAAGLAAAAITALTPLAAAGAPLRLERIEARLYYPQSGTLSADIPASATLFNTIIGEGWAAEPSNALQVQVVVSGDPGAFAAGRHVRLVARAVRPNGAPGAVLVRRAVDVGLLAPAGVRPPRVPGRTRVGFWVAGTGCVPVRLSARLAGGPATPALTRLVSFVCGE